MCLLCDEFNYWTERLRQDFDNGDPLTKDEAYDLCQFLDRLKEAHIDQTGEASWES